MKLPKLAIDNHRFAIIIISLLVLAGLVSYVTMPRSEDPQVMPAASSTIVLYPGASPSDLEELVINPIEEVLNELDDIKRLNSRALDGIGVVEIEFTTGSDPDEKYSDVVQKINSIRNDLPDDIYDLNIIKWTISDVQIMELALSSADATYRQLEEEAELLKTTLEKTAGVKRVRLWAYPKQEIRISINLQKLQQLQIPLSRVIQSIESANQNIPGGSIEAGMIRFNIKTSGMYKNLDDIKNTIVHSAGGQVVTLANIADVEYDYEDESYFARYKGKRALLVTISQKEGTNIFTITDEVKKKLQAFQQELPKNIKLDVAFDQSDSVESRMNGFFSSLLQGLILVGLVVFFALGLRASFIIMLVIPLSFLIAIGFVDSSGFGLEQMSIAGMVIALGLLVDNAIVVIQNISRFIKLGYSKYEAAVKGTSQIGWAVVSSTATTVLAFIPMMMMQNITGDFIRSMPVTVVYTLTASLLLSLMLTPWLSSKYLTKKSVAHTSKFHHLIDHEIEHRYRKTLQFALNKPKRIIAIALLFFTLSLALFLAIGVSFFPKAEKPIFVINVDTPEGSSLKNTEQAALFVESVLADKEQIKHYVVNVGHGNPRIYYNIIPKNTAANHSQIIVEVKDYQPDNFSDFLAELRQEFANYAGAKITVKELEQGPPIGAPIELRIMGENISVLKQIAADVEKILSGQPGTVNVNNPLELPKTDIHIKVNREKAAALGVPLVEIDRTVRLAVAGMRVSTFRDAEGKEYDLVMRLPQGKNLKVEDLKYIYVSSVLNQQIPLNELATITFESSPLLITHYNMERNVTVTSDVERGYSVDVITKNIREQMKGYKFPKGYRYGFGGELESREESFGGMIRAFIVAILGIFAVLVLQFSSFRQPFIVFSAIPLAMIGSVFALLITGYSFSFTAFIGFSSLIGIVINNSIILVDYTNQLRAEGKSINEALKEAGETRFLPIVLTTLTTVGGLLPLTLGGGSLWAPMGWTIIGGLLLSTVLTLIVVPVLYKLLEKENTAQVQES